MKIKSQNFDHLNEIPLVYTIKNRGLSPSLYWYDYPTNSKIFLILMTNLKTNKIYWATFTNKSTIDINEKTGGEMVNSFGKVEYTPPNDIDDIVTYKISVYSIINPNLNYEELISDNNLLDVGNIKFIYNGY